jgi:hypothetical protein
MSDGQNDSSQAAERQPGQQRGSEANAAQAQARDSIPPAQEASHSSIPGDRPNTALVTKITDTARQFVQHLLVISGALFRRVVTLLVVAPLLLVLLVPALVPNGWVQYWLQGAFGSAGTIELPIGCTVEVDDQSQTVVNKRSRRIPIIPISVDEVPSIDRLIAKARNDQDRIRIELSKLKSDNQKSPLPILDTTEAGTVSSRIALNETCIDDLELVVSILTNAKTVLIPLRESLRDLALAIRCIALGAMGALIGIFVKASTFRNDGAPDVPHHNSAILVRVMLGGLISLFIIAILESKILSIIGHLPDDLAKKLTDVEPDYWRVTVVGLLAGAFADTIYGIAQTRLAAFGGAVSSRTGKGSKARSAS